MTAEADVSAVVARRLIPELTAQMLAGDVLSEPGEAAQAAGLCCHASPENGVCCDRDGHRENCDALRDLIVAVRKTRRRLLRIRPAQDVSQAAVALAACRALLADRTAT